MSRQGGKECSQDRIRIKGLGEISPKELAQFIGKEIRLSKVEYAPRAESTLIQNFYMGKNTPACVAVANSENEQTEPSHM